MKKVLFALLTICFGAFAGVFAWAFFFLMDTGIGLLWETIPGALESAGVPVALYPLALCLVGGLCVGLFARKFGDYPADMNTVMGDVKKTGRYEYDHMGASFFGALLPLLFGGSIGPEAGLTGVIAGLCTWVGDRLRFVGAEMRELAETGCAAVISVIFATPLFGLAVPVVGAADESDGGLSVKEIRFEVAKPLKIAVYVLAVAGALGAMGLLSTVFGGGFGLPHFSEISFGAAEFAWAIPLAVVGALAGWLYFPSGAVARACGARLKERPVVQALIAGLILGAMGCLLPFTMFAGEEQTGQLAQSWTTFAGGVLVATGFVKVIVTQFCLNLGWRGGHFFPVIFAGIAIGYGMAALTGIDPVFALCVTTAALMGAVMRQPLMTAALLLLVFPLAGIPVLLAAAALGALVPVPERWLGR